MRLFPIFLVLTCEAAISILNAIYQPIMAKAIFLSYRKLRFHTIKMLRADRTAAEW